MTARLVRGSDGATLMERLHVARRRRERMRGLLGRDALPQGEGLWIPNCRVVHTFGMRFPLDVVYVDRAGRVRKVVEGVRPGRLSACLAAHGVIELGFGAARKLGLSRGDLLHILE